MKKLYVPSPEQKESAKHGETLFPMQKYITKLDLVHPVVTTHWHEEAELTLITEGEGLYQIDLVDYEVKKGEIEKAKYKRKEQVERIIARWQYLEQIKVNIQNFFIRMFLRYPYMSIFNVIIIGNIVFKSYKYLQ